ncbi:CEQ_1a_G0021310.mRNA.1.CDS.1 [Saccharomyces cerevisiae]|nr:CEQ_1a_G0021310.mRNA.1.CDS.1 [Saccharomyces cerevisiae]CAI7309247.1 CEQ_1a_G0021310.mRNA.1.CDS.1 [Saccharomyces cerevisiae]
MAKLQRKRSKALGSSLEMSQIMDAGTNKIKRRIRDLERLLKKKKDILPSTVIIEKERNLQALRLELQNNELKNKIKANAKKYHMVRFFEKKKALRKYNRLLKKIKESGADDKDLQQKLRATKIELCYVINFPKTEKYIALYPNDIPSTDPKGVELTNLRREQFLKLVAERMDANTLNVSFEEILKGKKLDEDSIGLTLSPDKDHEDGSQVSPTQDRKELDQVVGEDEKDDFFE